METKSDERSYENGGLTVGEKSGHASNGVDDQLRLVSFHEPLTTSIHNIPRRSPEEIEALFYNRDDFADFQAKEQRRYDKMMATRIQDMVQEAMKDKLEAAYARNATPEEIDAMMPQTTEEIFSLLGGISALDMPKPPSAVKAEPIYQSPQISMPVEQIQSDHVQEEDDCFRPNDPEEEGNVNTTYLEVVDVSDSALSVTKGETMKKTNHDNINAQSPSGKEKKHFQIAGQDEDGSPKRQKQDRSPRLDHSAVSTDEEIVEDIGRADQDEGIEAPAATNYEEASSSDESIAQSLNEAIHTKFHLGNDNPSERSMLDDIEKNEELNDLLGTSFSSELHVQDLVPMSPENSPQMSPMRSPRGLIAVHIVDLDKPLISHPSAQEVNYEKCLQCSRCIASVTPLIDESLECKVDAVESVVTYI